MSLSQFLAVLRRRRWWVLVLLVIGVGASAAASVVQTPTYRASSSVFVSVGGATVSDLSQGGAFSEARVASYAQLATSPRILRSAARSADLDMSIEELQRSVVATTTGDTVILTISATHTSPTDAAHLADSVADRVVRAVDVLERPGQDGRALVQISVFQKALVPTTPIAPRIPVNIAIGVLAGLGAGIAVALLRETVDTKVRSVETLRQVVRPSILAEIPFDDDMARSALVEPDNRFSERAEAFRQLRTHLTFTNLDGGPQTVVVTSSVPGEGKSSTAVNLALMLAQNGQRVLLLDADLRRPRTAELLGLEGRVGLSTLLTHQVEIEDAVQVVGADGLHVLAAGRVPPNPSELLGSRSMEVLLETVREQYDTVVIDAPPVLPVTDPAVLATMASGVLFVSSVDGRATTSDVVRAMATLDAVGARTLGVVANRVRGKRRPATYYAQAPSEPVGVSPRRARRAADGASA